MKTKAVLRSYKGHTAAIRAAEWCCDSSRMFSGSDDCTARFWDLPTESPLAVFHGHTDHIRTVSQSPASKMLWATGSYDHSIRVWDVRAGGATTTDNKKAAVTLTLTPNPKL